MDSSSKKIKSLVKTVKKSPTMLKKKIKSLSPKKPRVKSPKKPSVKSPKSPKKSSVKSSIMKKVKRSPAVLKTNVNKLARQARTKGYELKTDSFKSKIDKACTVMSTHDIYNIDNYCTKCTKNLPKIIGNIKYISDASFDKQLKNICSKSKKPEIIEYCNKCKHLLILNKSNIRMYSKNNF